MSYLRYLPKKNISRKGAKTPSAEKFFILYFAPLRLGGRTLSSSNFKSVKLYGVVVQDCFLVLVVDVVAFEKFRDVTLEHIR
jgi:hypothetical protein